MAPLGRIDEYDEKTQNFELYLERFEHFVTANAVLMKCLKAWSYQQCRETSRLK